MTPMLGGIMSERAKKTAEERRVEQSRAEQGRAEQSRVDQSSTVVVDEEAEPGAIENTVL